MAGSVELVVNTASLEKSEQKLATLSRSVTNRKLNVSFSKAKGATAESILASASQLREIGSALSELIGKTQNAVTNTRISFTETDSLIAQWFTNTEG